LKRDGRVSKFDSHGIGKGAIEDSSNIVIVVTEVVKQNCISDLTTGISD